MTAINRAALYAYFLTGLKPTQSQFADLVDSCLNLATTSAQSIASDVTVSGNFIISSSAKLTISGNLAVSGATNLKALTASNLNVTSSAIPTNGLYLPANNTPSMTANGNQVAQFVNNGSAANYLTITNSPTGSEPRLGVDGVDVNQGLSFVAKGNAAIGFISQGALQAQIIGPPLAVNLMQMMGAIATSAPSFLATGSDTNIGITMTAKGNAAITFNTQGANQAQVVGPPSSVNLIQLFGAITTSAPGIIAAGTDADIGLNIMTKGSAYVGFTNAINFAANGAVGTTMTGIGPTGSHTTVQEWLKIRNTTGVIRYIPCY